MKFIIRRVTVNTHPWTFMYEWTLEKGEDAICKSATRLLDEKACRSDIARARKSMPGVRFAKVVVEGE